MKWVRALTISVAGLALGAAAACGQSQTIVGDAVGPAAAPGDAEYNASQGDSQANELTSQVGVGEVANLGKIVVNQDGLSVYRFDGDKKGEPSTCNGACAEAWPPLTVAQADDVSVDGVDKALLGVTEREDGTRQLTIGGWNAYLFAEDTQKGEAKGQGAQGKWFAFAPDGKKAAPPKAVTVTVAVMSVAPLGEILTDAKGMTLYRFRNDGKNPAKSSCEGDCATKWPPLLLPEGAQLDLKGVDPAIVASTDRADGSKQVTVGGWALYTFAGDKEPCDTNGQGVGGTWFASTATGGEAGI
jgi:predicted lipoprotein with Yx(FWY)xxD motif